MTVAAFDGTYIAADSQWSDNSSIWAIKPKIVKWSGGHWVNSGRISDGQFFAKWLEDRATRIKLHKGFEAFFTENGVVYYVDSELSPIEAPEATAIGDGTALAIALMREGWSAKDAVECVCRNNVWCDYPVTVIDVRTT